jgi:hypothetical protein
LISKRSTRPTVRTGTVARGMCPITRRSRREWLERELARDAEREQFPANREHVEPLDGFDVERIIARERGPVVCGPLVVSARPAAASDASFLWEVVFVVAAPPRLLELEAVLVPARGGEVEVLIGAHQCLDATGVRGVGVVDDAVLERESAHPLALPDWLVDVLEVVFGAVSLLLLGEGDAEVVALDSTPPTP